MSCGCGCDAYREYLCVNGHYSICDCLHDTPPACEHCKEEFAYENTVDDTDCTAHGEWVKELVENMVIEKCNLGHDHTIKPIVWTLKLLPNGLPKTRCLDCGNDYGDKNVWPRRFLSW